MPSGTVGICEYDIVMVSSASAPPVLMLLQSLCAIPGEVTLDRSDDGVVMSVMGEESPPPPHDERAEPGCKLPYDDAADPRR